MTLKKIQGDAFASWVRHSSESINREYIRPCLLSLFLNLDLVGSLHCCYSVQSTLLIFLLLWLRAESIDTSDLMISYSLLSLPPSTPERTSCKRIRDLIGPRLYVWCAQTMKPFQRCDFVLSFLFSPKYVLISLSLEASRSQNIFVGKKLRKFQSFTNFFRTHSAIQ